MRRRRADATSANTLVWVAGTIMVVLFVGAFSYAFYGNHGAARVVGDSAAQALAVAYTPDDVAEKDTDGDGVPDWEELLWGTNPNSTDTDGDGTSDFEERRLSISQPSENTGNIVPGDFSRTSTSVTQTIARELLGAYMVETTNANVDLSEPEQLRIVQQTLQTATARLQPPSVRADELSIVPPTPEAQQRYILDVVTMVMELGSKSTNDYELMGKLSSEIGTEVSDALVASAAETSEYAEKLRALSVPEDAVAIHTKLTSAFLGYAFTVDSIASLKKDPVRAGVGIQMLLVYDQLLRDAADEFMSYGTAVLGAS